MAVTAFKKIERGLNDAIEHARREQIGELLRKAWDHIASEEAPEHLKRLIDALK